MIAAARTWWTQAAEAALDLVVPQRCAGCGAPGTVWCPTCAWACDVESLRVPGPVPGRAACEHAGPAGHAVVAFKDEQVRRLAGPLGALLARAVRDALVDARTPRDVPVWVVPVPSRRGAVRGRGADHTEVLAGRAARVLRGSGIPAHRCPALQHVRASRDQVGLSRPQRLANVAGSLRALSLPPGVVVVVDDVSTTGATLAEAVRALGESGRWVTCVATVTWSPGPRAVRRGPVPTSVEGAGGQPPR
jgi:predicted amidophosphoribosyltransferase